MHKITGIEKKISEGRAGPVSLDTGSKRGGEGRKCVIEWFVEQRFLD
jgi:hypothetical protein